MKKNRLSFSKFVTLDILLYPILQTYGFYNYSEYNFAFIITFILALYHFAIHPVVKMPKLLIVYFVYFGIIYYLSLTSLSIGNILPIFLIKTVIIFSLFFDVVDFTILKTYYERIAWICIVFFFIQTIMYIVLGYRISGFIPGMPIAIVDNDTIFKEMACINERSSSFFSEPAHFVQFLGPILAIELFDSSSNKRRPSILCIVIIIALIFSYSGNALLVLGITVIFYLFSLIKRVSLIKAIGFICISTTICLGGVGYYIKTEMGQKLFERQDQINADSSMTSDNRSGFIRIFRGYYVFEELSPIRKIFGDNNIESIDKYIKQCPVSFMFDDGDRYLNSIQSFLIRTGYTGLAIFLLLILSLYRNNTFTSKNILILLLGLSFISSNYFSCEMMLYLLIPYKLKNKSKRYIP